MTDSFAKVHANTITPELNSKITLVKASDIIENNQGAEAGQLIKAYLRIKDALVAADQVQAGKAGKALAEALMYLEKNGDQNAFGKTGKAALKSALSISNAADIKLQRKAFKDLSESMYQWLKNNHSSVTLYLDYCPMAKASWLSDRKEIENPYYGQSMLSCGTIKDTLNP